MKIIEIKKIDFPVLYAALTLAALPVIGLLTGTAITFGLFGANYQEVMLKTEPQSYWFIIKVEVFVALCTFALSVLKFPLFESMYNKITCYRKQNRFMFFVMAFVLVPILATAFIILVMAMMP